MGVRSSQAGYDETIPAEWLHSTAPFFLGHFVSDIWLVLFLRTFTLASHQPGEVGVSNSYPLFTRSCRRVSQPSQSHGHKLTKVSLLMISTVSLIALPSLWVEREKGLVGKKQT